MSINTTQTSAYAKLGNAWLRDQTDRLHQRHLQFRRHFRLDFDVLLARAANPTQAPRPTESVTVRQRESRDPIRRTKIEAIDHCAQLEARYSDRVVEVLAASPAPA
ncbi:hypothetical protein QTH90_28970 [Variovorax sp. J2P1-59]|uniref:hypothetical protein n=1 Tax=Variovorax flavidus TaxID=3053501 RepID=UPI0025767981|nr:hypothetical protein [Variovorax sp. J2P1-59]MDM0078471.1 hypothetical protein [Variovorax sp. J2P1-59]